jgi:hypothetical protein
LIVAALATVLGQGSLKQIFDGERVAEWIAIQLILQ